MVLDFRVDRVGAALKFGPMVGPRSGGWVGEEDEALKYAGGKGGNKGSCFKRRSTGRSRLAARIFRLRRQSRSDWDLLLVPPLLQSSSKASAKSDEESLGAKYERWDPLDEVGKEDDEPVRTWFEKIE